MSLSEKIRGQIEKWQTSRKEEAIFRDILEKKAKAKERKAFEEGYIKGRVWGARKRGFEEGKIGKKTGGILDTLGSAAWEQFGEGKKSSGGIFLPHLESNETSGFGFKALEAEGILGSHKRKKHRKR